jgi:hypothetical protein
LRNALAKHKHALAEFVGRILGDGSPLIEPNYPVSEIESQKRMRSLVLELSDYLSEIKIAKGNYRIQLRRQCGRTLRLLGIPFGRKSVTNPSVPTFVMESDQQTVWLSFLRGLFDDEAYVSDRGIEIGLAVRQAGAASYRGECPRVTHLRWGLRTSIHTGHTACPENGTDISSRQGKLSLLVPENPQKRIRKGARLGIVPPSTETAKTHRCVVKMA